MAAIPWGHNVLLVEQFKELSERRWYARKVVENGWSRNVLVLWIEAKEALPHFGVPDWLPRPAPGAAGG
jgi:predicted nuclease of restriction endonuclease-like (RecB) superfamily